MSVGVIRSSSAKIERIGIDFRLTGVAISTLNLDKLVPDHIHQPFAALKDIEQVPNMIQNVPVFFPNLFLLQSR